MIVVLVFLICLSYLLFRSYIATVVYFNQHSGATPLNVGSIKNAAKHWNFFEIQQILMEFHTN